MISYIELRLYISITGKGVVTKIIPVDYMPVDEHGNRVHAIINSYTMNNRVNPGQCDELEVTFFSQELIHYMYDYVYNSEDSLEIILKYLNIVAPKLCDELEEKTKNMSNEDLDFFVHSVMNDAAIYTSMKPISESLTIDDLERLVDEFPQVQQVTMYVPITGSTGEVRFVPARRKVVSAPKYMYRLKQYAEEKFSVTSLSATNIKNENTRSKASKNHTALHTNTPVKFGETKQLFAA